MSTFLGRLLTIDLTTRKTETVDLEMEELHAYLGGRGLGARLLTRNGKHLIDPLSPSAALLVAAGPLTATRAPGSGRLSMSAISPLTGTLFDSNSGGFFGARLKGAGFDALWVEGRADAPLSLFITPDGVRMEEAGHLWTLGNGATRKALEETGGKGFASLTIGTAGAYGSLMANICHDGRFFGRGGLGALFGSKNLKSISVAGDYRPRVFDRDKFGFIVDESRKLLAAHPITSKGLKQFGTSVMMNLMNSLGALPVGNFREGSFPGASKISGEALRENLLAGSHACPGCPIGCGRKVKVDGEIFEGPEFETLWSFGADLKIDDLAGIARLNRLANDLGMDTISAGSTIAAARELYERGLSGFDPLEEGVEGVGRLLTQMAARRGAGEALADGSRKYEAGTGVVGLSMAVKGLELPAYDPRGCQGQGLAYATSNRGGCHLRSYMVAPEILASPKLVDRFSTTGKAGLVIVSQNLNAAVDSLVMCRFMSFAIKDDYYARLLRYATGMDVDAQGLMTVGERIYNLERLANMERGLGREDDTLPGRLLTEAVGEGAGAGRPVDLAPMLDEYYRFRGWDETGLPAREKLLALGLTRIIHEPHVAPASSFALCLRRVLNKGA